MTRIITIISRFLLLGLIMSSLVSGIAYLLDWPLSVSAVFFGIYFSVAIILYLQQRIWIMKNIWDHLSSQNPKFKNLMICLFTAIVFAISSIMTSFISASSAFRIINVSLGTILCYLTFSLLYYSNKRPLQKFWHFMIAKPKKQKPSSF